MIPVNKFLPYVLPEVPGCSRPLARQAIVLAAHEFCRETDLVQLPMDPIDIVANEPVYDMSAPTEQTLVRVIRVWFEQTELRGAAPDEVRAAQAFLPLNADTPRGDPSMWYQQEPLLDEIKLWPVPNRSVAGGLMVRASFRPKLTAKFLENILFDDWVEVIAAGALARLHSMPAQGFSDVTRAADHMLKFRLGKGAARTAAARGKTRNDLRVQMRPFA